MQDKLFSIIFNKDEITWKSLIYDLIKLEGMDPWDVDISLLTHKYIEMISQLKEFDLKVSGKVVLAAAILLKIKSKRLLNDDLLAFDQLFAQKDENDTDGFSDFGDFEPLEADEFKKKVQSGEIQLTLIPKTPQPRTRKVSVYDLIDALQKAMDVKQRRLSKHISQNKDYSIDLKKVNVEELIHEIFLRINDHYEGTEESLTFSKLLPSEHSRDDKVFTFIPLLHLTNQRKIDLHQKDNFSEIYIDMNHNLEMNKNE